jgi:hypothetical protein
MHISPMTQHRCLKMHRRVRLDAVLYAFKREVQWGEHVQMDCNADTGENYEAAHPVEVVVSIHQHEAQALELVLGGRCQLPRPDGAATTPHSISSDYQRRRQAGKQSASGQHNHISAGTSVMAKKPLEGYQQGRPTCCQPLPGRSQRHHAWATCQRRGCCQSCRCGGRCRCCRGCPPQGSAACG